MVFRAVLRTKLTIKSFTKYLFASSLKNMEKNIIQQSILLVPMKTDSSIQCSLFDDLKSFSSEPSDCLPKDEEEEKTEDINAEESAVKRKVHSSEEFVKEHKKVKLDSNKTRPGFNDERFNETSYYFENGLRKVYPYYFTFTTYTKGRWVGRTLLEVFGKEFRAHSSEEYERHIKKGLLTINNEHVSPDYVLKHNDLLSNVIHRHEVPVSKSIIEIIHLDKDIVVINKPASIPVHPCGRYRHNTIIFLLAKEYNLKDLKTIHRLDRLTSGVLMFGRTQNKARILEAQMRDREVKKQYVCRVEGKFPESLECVEPIEVVSYKIGVCKVSPKGKQCRTSFQLIGYNEKVNTSIVICTPYSGRMHQIRVHLQYLGYPIKNDPLYNDTVFGPEKGRGGNFGKTDEQLIADLILAHNAENWSKSDIEIPEVADTISDLKSTEEQSVYLLDNNSKIMYNDVSTQTGINLPDSKFDKNKFSVDPHCQECKTHYKDPEPKDLVMYLHAFRYSGPNWLYETSMPVWADVNWTEPL